jgi:SAM-dependent methyltransferase
MPRLDYGSLKRRIVPTLRFNQEIYEDLVARRVSPETRWLDAGGGHQIFPAWREATEREMVARAGLVVGTDLSDASLRRHRTIRRRVVSDLGRLPLRSSSMTLITCNTVVEHLDRPLEVFREFARVLAPGGRVVVLTPNLTSHFVIGSALLPRPLKLRLVRALDGRPADDVFPTRYHANTPGRLRKLMERAGLRQDTCRLLASDAVFSQMHPVVLIPELLYIRLTLLHAFKLLRVSILAEFVKPTPA